MEIKTYRIIEIKDLCSTFKSWNHASWNIDQRSALCIARRTVSALASKTAAAHFLRVHCTGPFFSVASTGTRTKRGRAERRRNNVSLNVKHERSFPRDGESRCDRRAIFPAGRRQRENAIGHLVGDPQNRNKRDRRMELLTSRRAVVAHYCRWYCRYHRRCPVLPHL